MGEVVYTIPYGKIILKSFASAAAASSLTVQPGTKRKWLVMDGWGYHDDTGGNHTLNWRYYDGSTSQNKTAYAVATYIHLELCRDVIAASSLLCPLVLDVGTYLVLASADAMAAGKKLYAELLVMEFMDE